jgi:hypothetical protein
MDFRSILSERILSEAFRPSTSRLRAMGQPLRKAPLGVALVLLMLASMFPPEPVPYEMGEQTVPDHATPLGQATKLTVGSWPDGANQRVQLSVPDGHAIMSLGLGLEASTLTNTLANSMTDAGDFDTSAPYDGMDVNASELKLLPQDWIYDFESGTFAQEWTLSGSSNWAIQSGSNLQGARWAKAGSISHNQQSIMTLDVSQLPASSGTFQYRVSSESSFDYLVFCIDNTGCSRTIGYANRWSGSTSGTQSFSFPASAQTLTWKYHKDGSVNSGSDTAWVDNIQITPTAGSGNGEGNWTSEIFGPSLLGRGESTKHGLLHMDLMDLPGSVFEYQVLNAQTSTPVPGFERLTLPYVDLGMIDEELHPLLRLKIHMKEASSGGGSEIRSLSHNGLISKSFTTDPSAEGWQIQGGSWANGAISSSGIVLSNRYDVRSGFSAIQANNVHTGPGVLQYSLDGGGSWQTMGAQERVALDEPAFSVQFRMDSTGGTYTWQSFEVELVRTSVVSGLRMDVGIDGTAEWSLDRNAIGSMGLQHTLVSGEAWVERSIAPASTASLEVALPTGGVEAFSFAVASPTGPIANPFLAMAVNGQDILSRNLANINDLVEVRLTPTELQTLNNALGQATNSHGVSDLPMATVELRIGSSLSTSQLHFGGVFAPYATPLNLSLNAVSPLVMGLNHALADIVPVQGQRTVTLPVRMDGTGSVYLTVNSLETQASVKPIGLELANVSDTLVPGNDWVQATSTFDFSPLNVADALTHARQSSWEVELQLVGQNQRSLLRCPVQSLPVTPLSLSSCSAEGTALLWFDEGLGGSISAVGSGPYVEVVHHFKFPDGWDDEPSAVLTVHLISTSGPMLPVSTVLGLGDDQGVENDLEVKAWSVVSDEGIRSSSAFPYLRAGELVQVEVVLGFEGTDEGTPRSGQALVRFLVDGTEYATTTLLNDGVASFTWNVPTGRPSIDLAVEVVPLRGQAAVSDIPMEHRFLFDNVAPTLLLSSVASFDNRDVKPVNDFSFTIADRPHLPVHAVAYLWHSWLDDTNGNGVFDNGEQKALDLSLPENLTNLMGQYGLAVDTSDASEGDYFLGWLEVADSAGHVMEDGGSLEAPMFHVQLNTNGAPSLGATTLGWPDGQDHPWFHPGELNQIRVPVWEQNGIFDLAEIRLDLASNTARSSEVHWNQSTGLCASENVYIEVDSCNLVALEEGDVFSRNGEFVVNFTLEWGFDPDTSLIRTPQLSLKDQSGQSNTFLLEPLGWRFSGELAIEPSSIRVGLPGESSSALGYWVQPRTTFDVSGDLVWYRTGTVPHQDLHVELQLGENAVEFEAVNGSFSGSLLAPLQDGTYGLMGSLYDAPNGAVYRGDNAAFVWFIVDNEAPRVVAVDRPGFNSLLAEDAWKDLEFELRLAENARLDEASLMLHWSLNEAGLGLNSYVFDNGSLPLMVMGERINGDSIPVQCSLDLDALMLPVFRTRAVELRVWVTGNDEAGLSIDSVFNDIDAPLRVWTLEQRVPEFTLSNLDMDPQADLRQGDFVEVAAMLNNVGLADGEANMVLELVESSGARTRLDARTLNVQSGEQVLYQYLWKPGREGTQWLELSIINGPGTQSSTVFVDEARSEGVLGTISSVNPALLSVVGVLVLALVGLLVFGLRREALPDAPLTAPGVVKKTVAALPAQSKPASGPYGATEAPASPGENPYQ